MNEARVYKIENEKIEHDFEIKDGDVVIHETITRDLYFKPREFLTYFRSYKESIENWKKQLSDEYRQKVEKTINQLSKDVDKMNPIVEKIDDLLKEQYEKVEQESILEAIKNELKKGKNANVGYLNMAKERLKPETLKKITKNELAKLNRLSK